MAVIIIGVAIGPLFWTLDPEYIDIIAAYQLSSPEHPWGTDSLGRDTLARALQGGRVSLMIGVSAMLVSITIGTVVGLMPRVISDALTIHVDAPDGYLYRLATIAPAAGADDALPRTA